MADGDELQGRPDPRAIDVDDAASLLERLSGWPITGEMIRSDIAAGAPLNPDGTLDLIRYAAWLAREMSSRD